ncbi:MAG: MFS transporter [Gemmatimonadetes bacterium]|nr:MFS transporter [Gemmatimonadota bacterium]MBU08041.1 MFS transporter [Gemmatimonadota bacterium]MDP7363279.1 ATP-binding cassette domain-containing protein [Candidatus Latescibacterota bacterium]MDP7634601.1 ATP-binding cassette domain-containing protein [Candidatus Latescibacterota bacterium]HCV24537.1 MFS transporter [Candidatus Latescibacterota bacterium]
MIEVDQLSKEYGDVTAVDGVSFRAERGQILGFLGPNGAGKTTTMRMLTCYLPPSAGTASVDGYDVVDESMEVRRRIGYLPESPPVYMDMTVDAYLGFVARIKGVPTNQMRARIDETMEKTGVAHVRSNVIGHLSKGYRQRVGLAQALVHNPSVLILDEPTVGLDPKQIIEIREVIKSLRGEHTIVLSTHILPEVSMTCEKVVIISQGRIVGEGSPESLTAQLKESDVLHAQVLGPVEAVGEALRSIDGVLDARQEGDDSQADSWVISVTPGQDVRDAVSRAIIDGGFSLRELRSQDMSLEDIFLRLTTEETTV